MRTCKLVLEDNNTAYDLAFIVHLVTSDLVMSDTNYKTNRTTVKVKLAPSCLPLNISIHIQFTSTLTWLNLVDRDHETWFKLCLMYVTVLLQTVVWWMMAYNAVVHTAVITAEVPGLASQPPYPLMFQLGWATP